MSSFSVSPATVEDIPALATVSRAAFRDSPHTMSYWIFPQDNEKAIYEWRLGGITNIMNNVSECSYTKCVDLSTNKIAAFALWESPQPPKADSKGLEEDGEKGDRANGIPKSSRLPEGTNVELMNIFNEATDKMREKYVDSENDYVLRALATLPEYQGKGCGTLLLETGLEKIDAEGRKAWLEATPQGRHLYTKLGWKDVDEIAIDLGNYGCAAGMQKTFGMRRECRFDKES